jgi:hypothetical protein
MAVMPTLILSSDIAGDVKPCFASSPVVGLTVRSNGEEPLMVLDPHGNIFEASMPQGTTGPTVTNQGANAVFEPNKWAGWAYVYASEAFYPFVENEVAIGGSLAPRGNPSPATTSQINGSGQAKRVAIPQNSRKDIDRIWVFRTEFFTTQQEAIDQAAAGNLFYVGSIANDFSAAPATVNFDDAFASTDQVEVDNFAAPNFQYCVYADPYWWGWGNNPFVAEVSWTVGGVVTLTEAGRKWFKGRNGQYVKLTFITVGGADGQGTFIFKFIDNTHFQVTTDGSTNTTLPTNDSGTVTIQGPATTLYRSKRRNPFSWGETDVIDDLRIPQIYTFKVGGGLGTAIGLIPTVPYLLLSTEFPAGCYTLDLRQAGTDAFRTSLRKISEFYSITSHFSQFVATKVFTLSSQEREERLVLWGWDAKNYVILECDGVSVHPVGQKIIRTLRGMTITRSRQLLAHGAYDSRNHLNCLWLPSINSGMLVNMLVCQHAPTGNWFLHDEHDVLCSAQFQDPDTNVNKIFVGTQGGFLGEAFAENQYIDWIGPDWWPIPTSPIQSATSNSITSLGAVVSQFLELGLVGNWMLVVDAKGEKEQWARISAINTGSKTISVDLVYTYDEGFHDYFAPVPEAGGRYYIGLIEARIIKFFDFGAPASDKKLSELWLTLENVDRTLNITGEGSTFLRYYRDRSLTPYVPAPVETGKTGIALHQGFFDDGDEMQEWFTREPPTDLIKTFGVEIIDRAFKAWKFHNWTLKMQ